MGIATYFIQGVRMSGFVGSSLVGFFSLLVFLTFISQFYALLALLESTCLSRRRLKRKGRLLRDRRPNSRSSYFVELASYARLVSGLVDSSFFDFFRLFFAIVFSLSNCPSGAMHCYMQMLRHSVALRTIHLSSLESADGLPRV
jgi:hypothetical protein